ncbi:hypothetical protein V5O48_003499 [Marasmius crinis-equi]|uniref:F-box domain-containing protein n=1 Tax=Marasmius crinis-equi TaxID=585013 RepID=A0ABR3FSQ8_9AGAR
MSLNHLPSEILYGIACLTGSDVKNLRLVNKLVNEVVESIMWDAHPIILDLNREHLAFGMSMLDDLGNLTGQKIRKLKIKSLDPTRKRRLYYPPGEPPSEPDDSEAVAEACSRLPDVLPRALSALKGLKSVRWELTGRELERVYGTVLGSLGSLSSLVDFEIDHFEIDPVDDFDWANNVPNAALPLQHLRNGSLQRLAITLCSKPDAKQVVSSLAMVLIHNPHIIHLELDMLANSRQQNELPFQDLFQNVPGDAVRLRSLLLRGWTIQVTPKVQPHLAALHSLELSARYARHEALWKSLSSSPPRSISRVSCGRVCDGFLDFLQSVSALEVLELPYAGGDTLAESDRLAQRFYQDIFPRHSSTLKKVNIFPSYTGMWTIGLHNVDTFDKCIRLTHLTVGLDPDEIRPGENERDVVVGIFGGPSQCSVLTHYAYQASFISRVVRLPELYVLVLPPVVPKKFFGTRRGGGTLRFHATKNNIKRTQDSLENVVIYDAPRAHQSLSISTKWAIGTRGANFLPLYGNEGSLKFQRPDPQVEPEPGN